MINHLQPRLSEEAILSRESDGIVAGQMRAHIYMQISVID